MKITAIATVCAMTASVVSAQGTQQSLDLIDQTCKTPAQLQLIQKFHEADDIFAAILDEFFSDLSEGDLTPRQQRRANDKLFGQWLDFLHAKTAPFHNVMGIAGCLRGWAHFIVLNQDMTGAERNAWMGLPE